MATDHEKLAQELKDVPNIVAEVFAEKMEAAAADNLFSNQQYGQAAEIGRAEVTARQESGEMRKR